MIAALGFEDHQRAGRLLIGYLDDDLVAVGAAFGDVVDDGKPRAHGRLMMAVLQLAAEVLAASSGGQQAAADALRASLAALTVEAMDRGDLDD